MGLFDFLKKKKKEEKKKERKEIATCFVCNKPIYEHEEYRVINWNRQRYYIHKKCFRQMKKLAKQMIGKII